MSRRRAGALVGCRDPSSSSGRLAVAIARLPRRRRRVRAYSQGLPDPHDLENIQFQQESIVYARDGVTELARFSSGEARQVVTFDQIPPMLVDATTAVEDKTFWTNTGFDPLAILSAALDSVSGQARGASTITQQLVRQRLLPPDLVQDPNRKIERKIKEIIQSIRVTQAFPGRPASRRSSPPTSTRTSTATTATACRPRPRATSGSTTSSS